MKTADPTQDTDEFATGGGAAGLRGYMYQVRVSVWVALELLIRQGEASEIQLEPPSDEDIEAAIGGELGLTTSSQSSLSGYQLVIQVKRRSTDWGKRAFEALLAKGSDTRQSPRKRLENPQVRYLLVTDAVAVGAVRSFKVSSIGQWPKPSGLPELFGETTAAGAESRVAVISEHEAERIDEKVKQILATECHVPGSNLDTCYETLRNAALSRMVGTAARVWTYDDVERIVVECDGYLAAELELQDYVRPTNWDRILSALKREHKVILKGASGTGKTLTARALIAEMRDVVPMLNVVDARTPADVVSRQVKGPVLFYLDDPWGRYMFEPGRQQWNELLPSQMSRANENNMFVVTSRSDVLNEAKAADAIGKWTVAIEAENYADGQIELIYRRGSRGLPHRLRELAHDNERAVLGELRTPFEVQKFYDALRVVRQEEVSGPQASLVRRAVAGAHSGAIEATLLAQIKARDALDWAVVLWALLVENGGITQAASKLVHRELARQGTQYESGFEQFVAFLVAGRSLRQADATLTYRHPRVEAAFAHLLVEEPHRARRVLHHLTNALVCIADSAEAREWGLLTAAHIAMTTRGSVHGKEYEDLAFRLEGEAQRRVDQWLTIRSAEPSVEFNEFLRLLCNAGSGDCIPGELARYVKLQAPRNPFALKQEPYRPTDSWVAAMRSAEAAKGFLERFVREVLPISRDSYDSFFFEVLEQIAGDLSHSYVHAASTTLEQGGLFGNASDIFTRALTDLTLARPVTERALELMDRWSVGAVADANLEVENGFFNDAHLEHMGHEYQDEMVVGDWLLGFVEAMRRELGWQAVRDDPLSKRLLPWWLSSAAARRPEGMRPSVDELLYLADCCADTELEEEFWKTARDSWNDALAPALASRSAAGGSSQLRESVASCLLRSGFDFFDDVLEPLFDATGVDRLFELFVDLWEECGVPSLEGESTTLEPEWHKELESKRAEHAAKLERWRLRLPVRVGELVSGHVAVFHGQPLPPLSEDAKALLSRLQPCSPEAMRAKLGLSLQLGIASAEQIGQLLANATDSETAKYAAEAASETNALVPLEEALGSRYAKAQAVALKALVERQPERLSSLSRQMAGSRSRYVVDVLLSLHEANGSSAQVEELVMLADNEWIDGDSFSDEDPYYPFAQRAAKLLGGAQVLSEANVLALVDIARRTIDGELRALLLDAVLRNGSTVASTLVLRSLQEETAQPLADAFALALYRARGRLAEEVVDGVSKLDFDDASPTVACAVALVVGDRSSDSEFERVAYALHRNPDKFVLLLVLAASAAHRPACAHLIRALLPAGHPALAVLEPPSNSIPRDCIQELGAVDMTRKVLVVLKNWFVNPPATNVPPPFVPSVATGLAASDTESD